LILKSARVLANDSDRKTAKTHQEAYSALMSDAISHRLIAEPTTILRGLVGSSVHGLVLSGTDDRDEMGVCVEPRRYIVGFGKFEQWVYRSPLNVREMLELALAQATLI
jgi:RNA repair pathway DNA polymerase beta family